MAKVYESPEEEIKALRACIEAYKGTVSDMKEVLYEIMISDDLEFISSKARAMLREFGEGEDE